MHIAETAPVGAALDRRLAEHLVHAFHVRRYGLDAAADTLNWRPRMKTVNLAAILASYEAAAAHRPDGWPEAGAAALLEIPRSRLPRWVKAQPDTIIGAAKILEILSRAMHAMAVPAAELAHEIERAPRRIERRNNRCAAQQTQTDEALGRHGFSYRAPTDALTAAWVAETERDRYQRVREQLMLTGDHPAYYADLDTAELALLEHERAGRLPAETRPRPSVQRWRRGASMPDWWAPPRPQIGPTTALTLTRHAYAERWGEAAATVLDELEPVDLAENRHGGVTLTLTYRSRRGKRPIITDSALQVITELATEVAAIDWIEIHDREDAVAPTTSPADRRPVDGRRARIVRYQRELAAGYWCVSQ